MNKMGMLIRRHILNENQLGMEVGGGFPEKVTIELRPDRK